MTEYSQFIIDPYLLCLPNPCNSADQLEDFVSGILGWRNLVNRKDSCILLSESVLSALIEDEEYPYQHRLNQLLHQHDCRIATTKDIRDLVIDILERTPSLEDYFGIETVLVDETNTHLEPNMLLQRLKTRSRSALIENIVAVSVMNIFSEVVSRNSIVIASVKDHDAIYSELSEVLIDSVLHGVEWRAKNEIAATSFPITVSDHIPLAWDYDTILRQFDLWTVWDHARDNDAAIQAIELCITNLQRVGVDCSNKLNYTLGKGFLESARRWSLGSRSDYASILIESCARIILGKPKNPLKEYRETINSSTQLVRSDEALAFRTHLTKKGIGLRLMYWKLPDGSIEFANVGDKDELIIL